MSGYRIIIWLLVALWYVIETPESPKVDVWITVIEFVAAPIWMRILQSSGTKINFSNFGQHGYDYVRW